MYSLYRAWFGGEETYPRLETLSPPDTLVRVGNEGEHHFVAHRGILSAHSGYLKALLATSTNSTTTSARGEATSTPVTSVSVSSVGGEAFAPLLSYMYTGRLEVTLENIYSVLLATHLLHMPGALEQCRAALLRLRGPPPPLPATSAQVTRPGTILRPVASRLVGPPLCWSQPSLYPPAHVGLSHLSNFQLSSGLSILPNPGILQEPTTFSLPYSFREKTPSPGTEELQRSQNPEVRKTSPGVRSTSSRANDREKSVLDEIEDNDRRENDKISVNEKSSSPAESNKRTSMTTNDPTFNRGRCNVASPKLRNDDASSASTSNTNGVVYDIACCDGPVRFHRVLNENYVSTGTASERTSRQVVRTSCPSDDDLEIRELVENDENGKPDGNTSSDPRNGGSSSSTGSYTCGYCRHTFKSHYCYRKHARRHLLPSPETEPSLSSNVSPNHPDARRREVKLLDLNVQYYPCKICGSKFPSYYFVHKHKKLCHANVEESVTSVVVRVTSNDNSSDP